MKSNLRGRPGRGIAVSLAPLTLILMLSLALPSLALAAPQSSEPRPSRVRVEGSPSPRGASTGPRAATRRPAGSTDRASGRATYGHVPRHHGGHGSGYWAQLSWGLPWWWGGYWGPAFWPPGYYWAGMEPRSLESRRTLSSLPGFLETDVSPRRARVLLDGEYVGQARDYDGRWDRLAAGAGSHTLEFSAPGYLTLRRTVDVGPSAVVRLSERLERGEGEDPRSTLDRSRPKASGVEKPSFLSIAVRPSDAAVYLDGIFLGLAEELERLHGASTVASGRHRLEAARPGYATRRVDFDVAGDEEPTRVEFELERLP